MAERIKIKPAPYSQSDTAEVTAVAMFEFLANQKNLKLDVRKRDKIPNIDGYIEVVDDLGYPVGKLEVQIKKLPDNERRIQCPMSLFAYSEITGNPILLIGVDINQKKAYWYHVQTKVLPRPIEKMEQETITIHFDSINVIDGEDLKYIINWKNIVETNLHRLLEIEKYHDIIDNSNPLTGLDKNEFVNIHFFIDEINNLLDGKFALIKKVYFPAAWKIGVAYYSYELNSITYTLYPIPYSKNDVQIKQVDQKLRQKLKAEGIGWRGDFTENPIITNPKKHALNLIEEYTLETLDKRLLNHRGSEFLAREFIFAFINRFYEPMGLVKKDEYTIDEIEKGFLLNLPIWIIEAINFLIKIKRNNITSIAGVLYRKAYFDPEMLQCQIMKNEMKEIGQAVQEKVQANYRIPVIPMGNEKFPFQIFLELLSFLKESNISSIKRLYVPKDFSRLKGTSGWVWELYSKESIDENLKTFFANLSIVYDQILLTNFPEISSHLPIFGSTSLKVVLYETEAEAKPERRWPIEFFNLVSKDSEKLRIDVRRKEKAGEYSGLSFKDFGQEKEVMLHGKKYLWIGGSMGGLDFIYEDLPMFKFVYDILKNNFKEYFADMRKTI